MSVDPQRRWEPVVHTPYPSFLAQTADLLQTGAKGTTIMWAMQTVSELSSHLNFSSHPLKRLQAKPKSAAILLPRVKEINRLQYRLTHGDIPSVLGCMVPKLNRGNKQVSVASLRVVCNMLSLCLSNCPD